MCKHATGTVAVNFKPESELKDLITWAMGFTCKNFILDPRIVSTGKKVTVIAPNKMNAQDAYRLFLASLSTMGLTVVPKGNALRIVESATAKSETVPIMKKGMPADEDQMVRYVLRPSYVQTETMRAALDSVRSPAGNVQTAGNILIITDYASQIRDMMSLAKTLDVQGDNDSMWTIPVKNADATQLAQKLNDILGITAGGGGAQPGQPRWRPRRSVRRDAKGGGPATGEDVSGAVPSKILVDDRTNTLIVVASEAGYQRVKALVDRLDILLDTEGGTRDPRLSARERAREGPRADAQQRAPGPRQQQGGAQGRPGQPGAPPPAPVPASAAISAPRSKARFASSTTTRRTR